MLMDFVVAFLSVVSIYFRLLILTKFSVGAINLSSNDVSRELFVVRIGYDHES